MFTVLAFSRLRSRIIRDPARSGSIDREQFARLRAAKRCRHSDCGEWPVLSPDTVAVRDTGRTPIWPLLSRERTLSVPVFAGFVDSPPGIRSELFPRSEPTLGDHGCRREDSGLRQLSDCAFASICGSISRLDGRRMHHTPIGRSAPTGTKLVKTVTRTATSPSSTTGKSRSCATP